MFARPAIAQEDTGFFGTKEQLEIDPEVDVFYRFNDEFRLYALLQPSFVPKEDYTAVFVGAYVDWFVAPPVRHLISPDPSKERTFIVRLGGSYTGGSSRLAEMRLDLTPKYFLPWGILFLNRNRVDARWNLASNGEFSFRLRPRFQFEREFAVGKGALTPFVNVEWVWQSPPQMWQQFRVQGGLQFAFGGIGRGQILELNYMTQTYLQPSRSWRPVVGVVWAVYLN